MHALAFAHTFYGIFSIIEHAAIWSAVREIMYRYPQFVWPVLIVAVAAGVVGMVMRSRRRSRRK